ncbi:MAG: preprotein translocase subunit SecE [Planctomycetota bacterium]
MFRYKPDQGVLARGAAFWLATALTFFGCQTLWGFVLNWPWGAQPLTRQAIPVIHLTINVALIAAFVLFVVVEYVIWRLINKPKIADMLVETEAELRRVTWPSWDDTLNSSLVVIATVVVFLVFLAGSDWVLNWVFGQVFFKG